MGKEVETSLLLVRSQHCQVTPALSEPHRGKQTAPTAVESRHVCVHRPSLHTQTCQARDCPHADPSLGL